MVCCILGCLYSGLSWYSLMTSCCCAFGISRVILKRLLSCLDGPKDLSLFCTKIVASVFTLSPAKSLCWLRVSALLFSFSGVYTILNL